MQSATATTVITSVPCQCCGLYKAQANCYSCQAAICLACRRLAFVNFQHKDSVDGVATNSIELLKRCRQCDKANALPTVRRHKVACYGSDCLVQ